MLLMNSKGITVHVRQSRVGRAFEQLGLRGSAAAGGLRVYLILNAFWQPLDLELPATGDGGYWRRWIDTALESPQDTPLADRARVPRCYLLIGPRHVQSSCCSTTSGEGKLLSRLVKQCRGHRQTLLEAAGQLAA